MAGETTLTVTGNLTSDPDLRYTPAGAAVCSFTVASTSRAYDQAAGKWKDGDALFLRCSAWRDLAENIAESLRKGARVVVTGRLKQKQYETAEGEKRQSYQLDADEVGASLRYAQVKVMKMARKTDAAAADGGYADDPRATANSKTAAAQDNEPPF